MPSHLETVAIRAAALTNVVCGILTAMGGVWSGLWASDPDSHRLPNSSGLSQVKMVGIMLVVLGVFAIISGVLLLAGKRVAWLPLFIVDGLWVIGAVAVAVSFPVFGIPAAILASWMTWVVFAKARRLGLAP